MDRPTFKNDRGADVDSGDTAPRPTPVPPASPPPAPPKPPLPPPPAPPKPPAPRKEVSTKVHIPIRNTDKFDMVLNELTSTQKVDHSVGESRPFQPTSTYQTRCYQRVDRKVAQQ